MEDLQKDHAEGEQSLGVARLATREADANNTAFDSIAFQQAKLAEVDEQRREHGLAAAAAADAGRAPAAGGVCAPPPAAGAAAAAPDAACGAAAAFQPRLFFSGSFRFKPEALWES
ncbi:unnamed protein product, partial [Prorocentrum cordatum]